MGGIMATEKLTAAKVRALTVPGMYGDGGTLFFRVWPGGSRSWVQRVQVGGKPRSLGLGGFPLVSLAEAREAAYKNRKAARAGVDVLEGKRADATPTFAGALEKVLALHSPTWRDGGKTEKIWRVTLGKYALPRLGNKKVSDVTSADVLGVVGEIWNTKNETAKKIKRSIGAVMKWAVAQGLRSDNPAATIDAVLPKPDSLKKGHFRAVHHQDVGAAIAMIRATGAAAATKLAFEFLTLTATRTTEVREARWQEIDLDQRIWTLPRNRTKTAVEFRVPLSQRCVEILLEAKDRFGNDGLVFPSKGGDAMSIQTLSKLSKDNDLAGTPHGQRSAFRSWCADSNVSREIAESALGHSVKGVEASYQRSDLLARRRAVMEAWAAYIAGEKQAKVVNLR